MYQTLSRAFEEISIEVDMKYRRVQTADQRDKFQRSHLKGAIRQPFKYGSPPFSSTRDRRLKTKGTDDS